MWPWIFQFKNFDMRRSKKFDFGVGKYYFTLKSSPSNITMHRNTRGEAELTYKKYINLGKDVEWHGKWEGKKFSETGNPSV